MSVDGDELRRARRPAPPLDDLLATILADPDDLETRSVYADILSLAGDPRGEAIAIGCALDAAGVPTIDALVRSPLTGDALYAATKQHRRAAEIGTGFVTAYRVERPQDLVTLCELLEREPIRAVRYDTTLDRFELPPHRIRTLEFGSYLRDPTVEAVFAAIPEPVELTASHLTAERVAPIPRSVRTLAGVFSGFALAALRDHAVAPDLTDVRITLYGNGEVIGREVLGVLDGAFASARSMRVRNMGFYPQALDALAASAVPGAVRHLELEGPDLAREAFATLVGKLRLESIALTSRTLDESACEAIIASRSPIRRLDLGPCNLGPRMLGRLLAAHPIEALAIRPARSTAALVNALAADPNAAKLRELDLSGGIIADADARAFASPHLANLRRLALRETTLGDVGLRAITDAQLPDLVVLDLSVTGARITPELRAKRSLASIVHDTVRVFGFEILHATRIRPDELIAKLRAAGFHVPGNHQSFKVSLGNDAVFPRIGPTHATRARDVAYLEPDPARAKTIAAMRFAVTIAVTESTRKTHGDRLLELVRATIRAVDGVAWDMHRDALVDDS